MTLEDGGSATVALEDGSSAAALVGGVRQRFRIMASVLGGGGGRRTCNDDIGISVVEAEGFLLEHWHQHCKMGCVQCKGRTLTAMARR